MPHKPHGPFPSCPTNHMKLFSALPFSLAPPNSTFPNSVPTGRIGMQTKQDNAAQTTWPLPPYPTTLPHETLSRAPVLARPPKLNLPKLSPNRQNRHANTTRKNPRTTCPLPPYHTIHMKLPRPFLFRLPKTTEWSSIKTKTDLGSVTQSARREAERRRDPHPKEEKVPMAGCLFDKISYI